MKYISTSSKKAHGIIACPWKGVHVYERESYVSPHFWGKDPFEKPFCFLKSKFKPNAAGIQTLNLWEKVGTTH